MREKWMAEQNHGSVKMEAEGNRECPLWVHTPWSCRHSTLQFSSASLGQTAISVRDMGCPHYPPFRCGLLPQNISPLSFLLPTSPLSSGISPRDTACVSLEVFATLPWKTLLMFLLPILYIRICAEFLLELQVCICGQISSHHTRTIIQSIIILSYSGET